MATDREKLLSAAKSFCNAFADKKPLDVILSYFSPNAVVLEYGEPQLAPFVGRYYGGKSEIQEYFKAISVLSYEGMHFSEYVVDSEARKVSVVGRTRFQWIETGESWDETFTYRLTFDEELKVETYHIWADTGAAFLARQGKLNNLRRLAEYRDPVDDRRLLNKDNLLYKA